MGSNDKKHAIAANVLKNIASVPKVTSATAPVFCFDRLNKPKFLASAVLLKVKDCHFALTAGHVLDERCYSDLYIGSGDKVVLLNGSFGTTVPPGEGDRQQDKIDIGIVRLSKETVQDMREDEFLTLEDTYNLHTATTTGHYMFTGYPYSKHKRAIRIGQAEATPYSFATVPAPLTDYQDSGLDPKISLLLRFDKKNLWFSTGRVEGPDPTGVSGGGVWFLNNVFSTNTLRPLLVAIAIEKWKPPKPKCVLSTKLHVALSIIWDHFPELRT